MQKEGASAGEGGSGDGGGERHSQEDRTPSSMADDESLEQKLRSLRKNDQIQQAARILQGRMRQQLQGSAEDIKIFRIGTNAGEKSFRRLYSRRLSYYTNIGATTLGDRAVTPAEVVYQDDSSESPPRPAEDLSTFHIVEVVDPKTGNRVQQLFKDIDLYFVAFRFLLRNEDVNSKNPWYKFSNENIPSFFYYHNIGYESGYESIAEINIGAYSFEDIYHQMRKFTPLNAMGNGNNRLRVVRAAALIMSEAQRFGPVQEVFLANVREGLSGTLYEFDKLIHDWGMISTSVVSDWGVISTAAAKKDILEKRLKVWILKYNTEETPHLILRQEFAVTAFTSLAVTVAVVAAVELLALAWEALKRVVAVAARGDEVTE